MEENEVVRKLMDFLAELRCGNMQRESLVRLECYDEDRDLLEQLEPAFKEAKAACTEEHRKSIEDYIEQLKSLGFSQQQEAYCQGIVDAIQMLNGLRLLKSDTKSPKYFFR